MQDARLLTTFACVAHMWMDRRLVRLMTVLITIRRGKVLGNSAAVKGHVGVRRLSPLPNVGLTS